MYASAQQYVHSLKAGRSLSRRECTALREARAYLAGGYEVSTYPDSRGKTCAVLTSNVPDQVTSTFFVLHGRVSLVLIVLQPDGWITGGAVGSLADAIDVMRLATHAGAAIAQSPLRLETLH